MKERENEYKWMGDISGRKLDAIPVCMFVWMSVNWGVRLSHEPLISTYFWKRALNNLII